MFSLCSLFNDAFNISYCVASKDEMLNEMERIWKEAVVAYLRYYIQHLAGWTRENHGKPK